MKKFYEDNKYKKTVILNLKNKRKKTKSENEKLENLIKFFLEML